MRHANHFSQDNAWPVHGAGLGLRRSMLGEARAGLPDTVSFLEVAPENWMGVGGRLGKAFRELTERHAFITHGLSLSLGSPAPLDESFLAALKDFLDAHDILFYSEHLSYCSDDGHLYDLLPIPFTDDAVRYVAARIRRVQDILERPIAVENVSYYAAPGQQMSEVEFLRAVLDEADCGLLLDINNVYVNAINHGYDAQAYLQSMPAERVRYFHVAGHYVEAEDLRVDTHGSDVCEPVWQLLDAAYARFGPVPTLLERDFNIPPLRELAQEIARVTAAQARHALRPSGAAAEGERE